MEETGKAIDHEHLRFIEEARAEQIANYENIRVYNRR
jgi:hypothetical protein